VAGPDHAEDYRLSARQRFAGSVDLLVANGYGRPEEIARYYSWRDFNLYLDAIGRRRYDEHRWEYLLAVGDLDEYPDYVGPEDGRVDDDETLIALERRLESSPFVRRVEVNRPVEDQPVN
jgi:hypothetical protein